MQHRNIETETTQDYWVVLDEEYELAIWPANRELPIGWQRTEQQGTRAECLAYIQLGRVPRPARQPVLAHAEPH